jgi:hypothetical protein
MQRLLGRPIPMAEVADAVARASETVFGVELTY